MAKHSAIGLFDLLEVPANLVAGFVAGAVLPAAAVAAMVAGVRLATGKIPFLSRVTQDDSGERQLVLALVPPEEARALWEEHKVRLGAPLEQLRLEIQSVAEHSGAEGSPQP